MPRRPFGSRIDPSGAPVSERRFLAGPDALRETRPSRGRPCGRPTAYAAAAARLANRPHAVPPRRPRSLPRLRRDPRHAAHAGAALPPPPPSPAAAVLAMTSVGDRAADAAAAVRARKSTATLP